jgi:hypothetical protein
MMGSTRTKFIMGGVIICAVAAPPLTAGQERAKADMPRQTSTLPPPENHQPAAVVVKADYRYDDLLWENDRTAHRIYSRPLQAAEPPSGSGVDSWGKNVAWPFADRQLRTGDQHGYHGEGIDFYNVGSTRGAGGLGIWHEDKLWTSRNVARYRILASGGKSADFIVNYDPWPVDTDRSVSEVRRITLPLGTHFTRMVSTISSNKPDPLIVGIGIGKRTTGQDSGELTLDRSKGLLSWWGPDDKDHGRMAIAIRVDPKMVVDIRQDADNHLVLLRVVPGKPFVYYSGSSWNKGQGGFHTRKRWDEYASKEVLAFEAP